MRTLIGAGERRDGLYYFRGVPEVRALAMDGGITPELWHRRLGHPSDRVVQFLPGVSRTSKVLNKACDVCHQAKQTRDTFHVSEHTASNCFDLIHCGLWGPYNTPSSCGAKYFLTIVDDCSRAVWVFLLLDKTEVYHMFLSFLL